ncbi:hypothetical protein ACFY40_08370 [Streptomyces sp. NPDC012950]|uniref:hypothetical protein n=1 Tax=Streptomyces sp. NPDC012950 TaxID=3364858 RepID=UPI0036BD0120
MATSGALTAPSLHPDLPPELLWDLLALPGVGGDALAHRTDLPRTLVDEVLTAPDRRPVVPLARNPALSTADRRILAAHPDPWARTSLAVHAESLPPDLLARLLDDPEPQVRGTACAVYFCRPPHPVPPADLWPALLADPVTRAGVVTHLRPLAPELAAALAADPEADVRRAVAGHPRLPLPSLLALLEDGAAHVAREAGRNTALPAAEVRRIVTEVLRIRKREGANKSLEGGRGGA